VNLQPKRQEHRSRKPTRKHHFVSDDIETKDKETTKQETRHKETITTGAESPLDSTTLS
jgi:hypothetical protein